MFWKVKYDSLALHMKHMEEEHCDNILFGKSWQILHLSVETLRPILIVKLSHQILSPTIRVGSLRRIQKYPTTYIPVSSWFLFTVD